MKACTVLRIIAVGVWLGSGIGALCGWWSIHVAAFVAATASFPVIVCYSRQRKEEAD
jgi:hypothetical protein